MRSDSHVSPRTGLLGRYATFVEALPGLLPAGRAEDDLVDETTGA